MLACIARNKTNAATYQHHGQDAMVPAAGSGFEGFTFAYSGEAFPVTSKIRTAICGRSHTTPSTGSSHPMTPPDSALDSSDVIEALTRMLNAGPLDHLPKRRGDVGVLLALAAARFRPRQTYREDEVNAQLAAWLDKFTAPGAFDHVTLRRFAVDHRLLLRNPAGTAYRLNAGMLAAQISEAAQSIDPGEVLASLQTKRDRRKRERATKS